MSWMNITSSLFPCASINEGVERKISDILFKDYSNTHYWKYYCDVKNQKFEGHFNDAVTIDELRTEEMTSYEKLLMKLSLQAWQPSCYMPDKSSKLNPIRLNPIMQLDFDHLQGWDIDSLKNSIFKLPFVGCVSLSCSGAGLYALILIEEPERLKEYAKHCFSIFQYYSIPIDRGKGSNPTQLRYVSYDPDILIREDPTPLRIKQFNTPKIPSKPQSLNINYQSNSGLIAKVVREIENAQVGQRFDTVQKWAWTLGGKNEGLEEIKQAINHCSQFSGVESKYLKVADDCFRAGQLKPLTA